MGIEVRHGTAAAPVAAAAFGGAQGAARSVAARGFAAAATQAEQAKRELERMTFAADLREQGAQADFDRAQLAAGESQLRERDDLEFSLTTRQRMELDRLADAEAEAMASSDFTPEEKRALRYNFAQRRAGIQPVARPREQTPAERFAATTYRDPRTGAVFAFDETGRPGQRPIYEPPERLPTVQDRVKAWQVAATLATNAETGAVDTARAQELVGLMLGGGQGAPGEAPFAATGLEASVDGAELPGATGEAPEDPIASLDAEIDRISNAPVQDQGEAPAVEDINDLPNVRFQLDAAQRALRQVGADFQKVDEEGLLGQAVDAVMFGPRMLEEAQAALGRVQALQARQRQLQQQSDDLQGQRVMLAARARQQAPAQPSTAAAPTPASTPAPQGGRDPFYDGPDAETALRTTSQDAAASALLAGMDRSNRDMFRLALDLAERGDRRLLDQLNARRRRSGGGTIRVEAAR